LSAFDLAVQALFGRIILSLAALLSHARLYALIHHHLISMDPHLLIQKQHGSPAKTNGHCALDHRVHLQRRHTHDATRAREEGKRRTPPREEPPVRIFTTASCTSPHTFSPRATARAHKPAIRTFAGCRRRMLCLPPLLSARAPPWRSARSTVCMTLSPLILRQNKGANTMGGSIPLRVCLIDGSNCLSAAYAFSLVSLASMGWCLSIRLAVALSHTHVT